MERVPSYLKLAFFFPVFESYKPFHSATRISWVFWMMLNHIY